MHTVYVEWILLDNFLMDFLILYATLRLSEKQVCLWRGALGAVVGSIYALFAVLFPILTALPFKVLASFAMCAVARPIRPLKRFGISLLSMYGVTFVLGGAVLFFVYLSTGEFGNLYINLPILRYLLIGGALGSLLLEFFLRRRFPRICESYDIKATICGESISLNGFLDTGNALKDFAGASVIIADRQALLSQLSPALAERVQSLAVSKDLKMRPFYFSTLSGADCIWGIYPDHLVVHTDGQDYVVKAYIALGEHLDQSGYNAILGANICLGRL